MKKHIQVISLLLTLVMVCAIAASCNTSRKPSTSGSGASHKSGVSSGDVSGEEIGSGVTTDSNGNPVSNDPNHPQTGTTTGSKPPSGSSSSPSSIVVIPEVKPTIQSVKMSSSSYDKYAMVEATVQFKAQYNLNKIFDSSEIALNADITTPSGKTLTVPGFVMKDVTWGGADVNNWEEFGCSHTQVSGITSKDQEIWKIRFAYGEQGTYTLKAYVTDLTKKTSDKVAATFSIGANNPTNASPLKIVNNQYFQFTETGKEFVPVGYQMCWAWHNTSATYQTPYQDYEKNLTNMQNAGCNFTRIWGAGIGKAPGLENRNLGPGKYDMVNAQALDNLTALFRSKGVKMDYCFDSFNAAMQGQYSEWKQNPYNAACDKGDNKAGGINELYPNGVITSPDQYFTNANAIKLFKDRVRYTIARYGWDINIPVWEIMNEVDATAGYSQSSPQNVWTDTMAKHIKSLDYFKRPISTSVSHSDQKQFLFTYPSIDYVTIHSYYNGAVSATNMNSIVTKNQGWYPNKLILVSECGTDPPGTGGVSNWGQFQNGVNLKQTVWSSLMSGSANVGQYWWWDEIINNFNLSGYYKQISNFVNSFSFSQEKMSRLMPSSYSTSDSNVMVVGLQNPTLSRGVLYAYDTRYNWITPTATTLSNFTITIKGAPAGTYKIVPWNTWSQQGTPDTPITATSNGSVMTINVGTFSGDRAFTFVKQ